MPPAAREVLLARQIELARALTDESAPAPPGFDPDAVAAARELLVHKRARDAGKARARAGAAAHHDRSLGEALSAAPLRALGQALSRADHRGGRLRGWWRRLWLCRRS